MKSETQVTVKGSSGFVYVSSLITAVGELPSEDEALRQAGRAGG